MLASDNPRFASPIDSDISAFGNAQSPSRVQIKELNSPGAVAQTSLCISVTYTLGVCRLLHEGTVDLIYESAVVPEAWPLALNSLCSMVEGFGAALLVVDPQKHLRYVATEAYARLLDRFEETMGAYENVRPGRVLARRYCGFLSDLDVCTLQELDNDPIYYKFLRPNGVGWTAGTVIPVPQSDNLIFDFGRSTALTPFDRSHLNVLDQYRPHLARAALISARLGVERARLASEALSIVGLPAAVLDKVGRVLAVNSLFEGLAPRVAVAARDRIHLLNHVSGELLKTGLENLNCEANHIVRSILVPAIETFPALILHVVPIKRAAHDIFAGAAVILIATPLSSCFAPTSELLNALFDLTPAEARIAQGIFDGKAVADLAGQFGVAVATVRNQLKGVLRKTGAHRQSELVAMLSVLRPQINLPAPSRLI